MRVIVLATVLMALAAPATAHRRHHKRCKVKVPTSTHDSVSTVPTPTSATVGIPSSSVTPSSSSTTSSSSATESSATSTSSSSSATESSAEPTTSSSSTTESSAEPTTSTSSTTESSAEPTTSTSSTTESSAEPTTTSSSTSEVPPEPTTSPTGDIEQELLSAHNNLRAQYSAPAMTWSADLAGAANEWAKQCKLEHAAEGENLVAMSGESNSFDGFFGQWSAEAQFYDWDNPGMDGTVDPATNQPHVVGHFTQIVWKASTQLGCAVATCGADTQVAQSNGWQTSQYVVCRYAPAGNVLGAFADNVGPKTS